MEYREDSERRFDESVRGITFNKKVEYKCLRYDGSEFWAEINSSPLKDTYGQTSWLMLVCQDITERKSDEAELLSAKDRAEQSDRLKSAMLHNISHEIRTPLNAILGFSDLITDPGISSESKATYVEIIQESSDQLLSTINDLVDISTIQAKIVDKDISDVNVSEIFKGIYNKFRKKAGEKNITINISDPLKKPFILRTDKKRLIQIISNLVKNALKFSSENDIEIGYVLKDSFIEFYVQDRGIGIAPEYHTRIFEPFFQVEYPEEIKVEGTGMGLALCKAYVELLGGKIWLDSAPGKGSVFHFTIPVEQSYNTVQGFRSEEEVLSGLSVLITEDMEYNLEYLGELLHRFNINVLKAQNGSEAVETCRSNDRIDLVLMDIKMPVMDGYEAFKQIKKIRPTIPVVAQTAYVQEGERAISMGFNDFISKPYTMNQVISIIRKHAPK